MGQILAKKMTPEEISVCEEEEEKVDEQIEVRKFKEPVLMLL